MHGLSVFVLHPVGIVARYSLVVAEYLVATEHEVPVPTEPVGYLHARRQFNTHAVTIFHVDSRLLTHIVHATR